jgi:hypothetical protein
MPKIRFKGKEYSSVADMPAKIRHDYFKARAGYDVSEDEATSEAGMIPKGLENMPDEVREIYERVRGEVGTNPIKASPVDQLPRTEDLYRRSAPAGMQNQPSDEIVYKPSPPIIEPPPPIVESDDSMRRLAIGLLFVALAIGIVVAALLLAA